MLYGGNVPLLKSIETTSPLTITAPELLFLRFVAASVLVAPWLGCHLSVAARALAPALELASWLWIGYTLQILGLEKTSASVTSVTLASVGFIVQALEFFFDGKVPSPRVLLCSLGTMAGIALFAAAPEATGAAHAAGPLFERIFNMFAALSRTRMPHETWLAGVPGEALVLGGASFFAVHTWRSTKIVAERKRQVELEGRQDGADSFTVALGGMQCVLIAAMCALFTYYDSPYATLEKKVEVLEQLGSTLWLQIAACGILCTGLPVVVELFAFKVVPPAVAALIYCTIPLWGTCLGVAFLGDAFGLQSTLAGLAILLCSLAPSALDVLDAEAEAERASEAREAAAAAAAERAPPPPPPGEPHEDLAAGPGRTREPLVDPPSPEAFPHVSAQTRLPPIAAGLELELEELELLARRR